MKFWVGVEATKGTAVDLETWIPRTDYSLNATTSYIFNESAKWTIHRQSSSQNTMTMIEWSVQAVLSDIDIWYFLYSALWSVSSEISTEDGTDIAYKHTFDLQETNLPPTLTLGIDDPVEWNVSFARGTVGSLTISVENEDWATYSVDLMAMPWEDATHPSITQSNQNDFSATTATVKFADNLAWLDAAEKTCTESVELNIERDLNAKLCNGQDYPESFVSNGFEINWSFTASFESETFKDYNLNNENKAMELEFVLENKTIWSSDNPTVKVRMPLVAFDEFSKEVDNDDYVRQTVNFTGLYSEVDESSMQVEVINQKDSYTS